MNEVDTAQDVLVKIYNSTLDAIKVELVDSALPYRVSRATATLPQSTQAPIFTVSGGVVLITELVGEVTTVIETQLNNTQLIANPTVGADVPLCAVLNITADAVGTLYSITGNDFADAMIATTSGASPAQITPFRVAAGTIDLSCSASNTGTVKWTLLYIPVDSGASVVAV